MQRANKGLHFERGQLATLLALLCAPGRKYSIEVVVAMAVVVVVFLLLPCCGWCWCVVVVVYSVDVFLMGPYFKCANLMDEANKVWT